MSNEVKIKLTDAQKAKIKEATGKDLPADAAAWEGYVQSADGKAALASQNKASKFSLIGWLQKSGD